MSELQIVQIVALLGWLVIVGSALASHRLSWSKGVRLALSWAAIFLGVYLLFDALAS